MAVDRVLSGPPDTGLKDREGLTLEKEAYPSGKVLDRLHAIEVGVFLGAVLDPRNY